MYYLRTSLANFGKRQIKKVIIIAVTIVADFYPTL